MAFIDWFRDTKKYLDKNGLRLIAKLTEKRFRYKTMPVASEEYEGAIVEYIGTVTPDYTPGYFYRCRNTGTVAAPVWTWVQHDVQPNDDIPHWTGTHAEYEVVKDTLPAYTILHFTDDYEDSVGVVDKIEDNNMNGVTSNAVYDATKTISHAISEVTWNPTYVDTGTWTSGGLSEKCGIVQFTKIFTVKAGVPAGTIICSGLPRPAMSTEVPIAWDTYTASGGFFLDVTGDLRIWADVTTDTNCRLNLVYIKA